MMKQSQSLPLCRIVFWEPCTSPHKSDLFSALVAIAPDIEVICCANNELSIDRQAQGWTVKLTNAFRTIVAPSQAEIDQLVSEQANSTLHIFSGIRWVPSIVAGLKAVKRNRARFAIMSEPRVREGWKGAMRFLHSWLTESWLRRQAEFVLAQGRNGPPWFRSVGYPDDRIFPFAYFVDPPKQLASAGEKPRAADLPVQIGYVGRLVKMKGVFDLIVAVGKLGSSAQLSIVGSGPEEQALKTACAELQLDAKFIGVLPIQEVVGFMRKLDVLVLASTSMDDGWGVVVSEALMCGTAVIATPCVGASVMLDEPLFGRCVPAESPDSIANAVRELQASAAYTAEARSKREVLARSRLSAEGGASHLLEIIRWRLGVGQRPAPFYEA
jgi:glycosyltransferase involved in cell wall biosynthesis